MLSVEVPALLLELQGYPLRPELIESTYLLHSATGDVKYLEAGNVSSIVLQTCLTLQNCALICRDELTPKISSRNSYLRLPIAQVECFRALLSRETDSAAALLQQLMWHQVTPLL